MPSVQSHANSCWRRPYSRGLVFIFMHVSVSVLSNHIQEREEMEQKPVFTVEGVTYVYVQYNNLILMSVTKRNSNVALMLVYLYKLVRKCPAPAPPVSL